MECINVLNGITLSLNILNGITLSLILLKLLPFRVICQTSKIIYISQDPEK